MKDWRKTLISPSSTILKAIEIINESSLQVAMVVDNGHNLLGIITDGDIRRGIVNKFSLSSTVDKIMTTEFTVAPSGKSDEYIFQLMKEKSLNHIPVVDHNGRVVGLKVLRELIELNKRHENWIVLMAGGQGMRLRPLTDDCPKPLLKVGGKPLLETIITHFKKCGFYKFYISLNYKGNMIEEYFGDGSKFNVEIDYIREEKKLGTAGALHLLPDPPPLPLFIMNGDVLTNINIQQILNFHIEQKATATMCVREYDFRVPYGVVKVESEQIRGIEEKPVQNLFVNAGIYILEHSCLKHIPENSLFDMPQLFQKLLNNNEKTVAFPLHEYWIDIGRTLDFEKANGDFKEIFK